MITKKADDKTKRLALLADLQKSPVLDAYQRKWLEDELFKTRLGIEGEREAAFYIDSYLKDSKNHQIIHDLRLEVDGETAQIDHLFFNRTLHFFLIETKCFNGNVAINEHGEFSVSYARGKTFGIPSPIEQSKRHERVLAKVLDRLEITGRLGGTPTFHHLVMLHPKATIQRPKTSTVDTSCIIKADALPSWHQRWIDKDLGVIGVMASAISFRGVDTIQEWADKLVRQHRPANPLALPEFMSPKRPAASSYADTPPLQPNVLTAAEPEAAAPKREADDSIKKRLICATCGNKITYPEGKFCWNNEKRFGGFQYCREHQAAF